LELNTGVISSIREMMVHTFGLFIWSGYVSYELQNPKTSLQMFLLAIESRSRKAPNCIGKDAPRTRQKNMWLARYHNSSLDRFGERMRDVGKEFELSQMTIGEELLDF